MIQNTIKEKVPETKLGPHCKRWWSRELSELRQEMLQKRRAAHAQHLIPDVQLIEKFRTCRRKFGKELERAKRNHWRDWLEKATDPDLWTAQKYLSSPTNDGGKTRIPDLSYAEEDTHRKASTNGDKSSSLAKAFFPPKPDAQHHTSSLESQPKPPVCKMDPISSDQIRRHLEHLRPYKAPGPNGIPNIVLTKCADILRDRLQYIFAAMIDKGLSYEPWKNFTTIVIRKPSKSKYTVPKAYRPIALLNTMSKLLTAIIAEQLTYYTEKYNLLPPTHFGGRPAQTTNDAIHYLVYKIKDSWRKKQVTSVLFLDIEGAFPNAVNECLIRNLRKRRVPSKISCFVENMLKDRTTTLKFDDYESTQISIDNGIGQGDPLSMILYLYYNADLLEILNSPCESAAAYVDDTILIASAKTFEETHQLIMTMMTREGGAIEWAKAHNSSFEPTKLALIDFSHQSKSITRPPLTILSTEIVLMASTKYLGVILDQNLTWKEQKANVVKKGSNWTAQIRRVARADWGLTPKQAKKLYTSVAIPRMLYAIDVWCAPPRESIGLNTCSGYKQVVNNLSKTQRAGTLAITGGLRTTPTDLLNAHTNILPTRLTIDKHCSKMATRLASLPTKHPLTKLIKKSAKAKIRRHKSPLHNLTAAYKVQLKLTETLLTDARNPAKIKRIPFTTEIATDKERAKEQDRTR